MVGIGTRKHDLLSMADLDVDELHGLLSLAGAMKRGEVAPSLAGRALVLLLEKPSLRTRVSMELAMRQMGGISLGLGQQEIGLGTREPAADAARVLSRYASIIAARVFRHKTLEELAEHASVPVINALSDREHPCQALADLLTIFERFDRLEGLTVTYIGDGNNVAASLALGCAMTGCRFRIASPPDYGLPDEIASTGRRIARSQEWDVERIDDPLQAARDADVIYTDVWTSMGQEAETEARQRALQAYKVSPDMMALAGPDAMFLHPLPAHHGEEIAPGMLEHPQSAVFDQAENRLHAQKAVLAYLLGVINLGR